jgi:aspartate carbamoyltransferase catalytic subunit
MRHVLSADQFDKEDIENLFGHTLYIASGIRDRRWKPLQGFVLVSFFEAMSTRTRASLEAAMQYLGGSVVSTENAGTSSSIGKNEALEDTYRVLSRYGDVLVIRSKVMGAAVLASKVASCPVVNAGDGNGEHPTQALLDLFTIQQEFDQIDGLEVTMFGDLKYGRTVHSLTRLLSMYQVRLRFVSPEELCLPESLRMYLREKKVDFKESHDLLEFTPTSEVLYVTRPQRERMDWNFQQHLGPVPYAVPSNVFDNAHKQMVILHPLPRTQELPSALDEHPRSIYFEQAKHGLFVRSALLDLMLRPI